jgi:hypothetical protein
MALEISAFISFSFFHSFSFLLGQRDTPDLLDPEPEVNELTVLIISNQYTINVSLAGEKEINP